MLVKSITSRELFWKYHTLYSSFLLLHKRLLESSSPEALCSMGCPLGCSLVAGIEYTQIPVLLPWTEKSAEGAFFLVPEFTTCDKNGKRVSPQSTLPHSGLNLLVAVVARKMGRGRTPQDEASMLSTVKERYPKRRSVSRKVLKRLWRGFEPDPGFKPTQPMGQAGQRVQVTHSNKELVFLIMS